MIITSIFMIYFAIKKLHWHWAVIVCVFSTLTVIDLAFLGANLQKVHTGGWVPLAIASLCTFIMYTWNKGRIYLQKNYYSKSEKLSTILKQLDYRGFHRLPNINVIFITDTYDQSGGSFFQFLKLNRMLPEHILIVNYIVENIPHVILDDRFQITCLKENICEIKLHYGFMDTVSVPRALHAAKDRGLLPFSVDIDTATYMLEIPNVVASRKTKGLRFFWQDELFAFFVRNYSPNMNIEFYQLPYRRTIAIGTYYLI